MTRGSRATGADNKTDVKACPFCGSQAGVLVDMRVRCGSCGASGPFGVSTTEAIRRWNERIPDGGPSATQPSQPADAAGEQSEP